MINLQTFRPEIELKSLESELFILNHDSEFYLNEEDEKIWSYVATVKQKKTPVIFQLTLHQDIVYISYTAEVYDEELREKASQMAHAIKHKLIELAPTQMVKFEHPIIEQFLLYQKNRTKEHMNNYESILTELIKTTKRTEKEQSVTFILYGMDGKHLGNYLSQLKLANFYENENGEHELTIINNELYKNETSRLVFMQEIKKLGFTISYNESFEENHQDIRELFTAGLLQID